MASRTSDRATTSSSSLRWEDIDFDKKLIRVKRAVSYPINRPLVSTPKTAQQIGGHSDITTTLNIYARTRVGRVQEAGEKVEQLLARKDQTSAAKAQSIHP